MTSLGAYASLKLVGYVVLASMVASVAFAAYIAVIHWTGIGV